jgi:hypothetical protein
MSRHWSQHKYTSAENLWCWIDDAALSIENKLEEDTAKTGEFYKAFLAGQRELLNQLVTYLHEYETTLGEIAEHHGLKDEDE